MEVNLVVVQGKPEGMVISLKGPKFLIGRDPSCNLRPSSDLVSKLHCGLQILGSKVIVHDLGSKNGTFLNNERIEESTEVHSGDLLRVGPLVFAIQTTRPNGDDPDPDLEREHDALSWLQEEETSPTYADGADTMLRRSNAGDETIIERQSGRPPQTAEGQENGSEQEQSRMSPRTSLS